MKMNFISNLSLKVRSGGWSGANVGLFEALADLAEVSYVGPINPGNDYLAKVPSKVARTFRRPGAFHFFSKRRLDWVAAILRSKVSCSVDCNFFFGNTPWIHYQSPIPYFVYTDCAFDTYLKAYHEESMFAASDLARIRSTEAEWLNRAESVFVATAWGARALRDAYGLPEAKVKAAGMGGAISIPPADIYEYGTDLLFIAYDFESKGGLTCFAALKLLQERIPNVRLIVVGGRPPVEVLNHPKVMYMGMLNKNVPSEFMKYRSLLEEAFLLVHPSTADIGSAAILEAAYHGCPALAPNRFCYSDQVLHQVSGFLIDLPLKAEKFADYALSLYQDPTKYRAMRSAARSHALRDFTWEGVAGKINWEIKQRLTVVEGRAVASA